MESFLQYVTGGECYECGGKIKFGEGGQNMQNSPQAQPQRQPGADEQMKQIMTYLTDQISKGTSPNILKKNLVESGVKVQEAEQLIGMASQMFNQKFHKGLEPEQERNPAMEENPFGNPTEEQGSQNMRYGGRVLNQFVEGGFTRTDHNQISNIPETKFNRGMARMSGLSNVGGLMSNIPDAGGFGAGLKFLAGAAGFLGSAGLGIKKFTSDDRVRDYDKDGNITKDSMFPDKYKPKAPVATTTAAGTTTANPPIAAVNTGTPATGTVAANPVISAANPANPAVVNSVVQPGSVGAMTVEEAAAAAKKVADDAAALTQGTVIKTEEDGGEQEWNPFVDNRRKLNFNMPMYTEGGAPKILTYDEWVAQTKPVVAADGSLQTQYDAYKKQAEESAKKNTIVETGDPLGKVVANNALNGMQMMADSTGYFEKNRQADALRQKNIMMGNTMEAAPVINPVNAYGSMYSLNAGPGANQALATQGYTFDTGTTMSSAEFGGNTSSIQKQDPLMQYKKGGVYEMSADELRRYIEMGGEVEFLD